MICCDNGPEFAGAALDQWAHANGVLLDCIARGKPVQNGLAVWVFMMEEDEKWSFGKYSVRDVPIQSMTYFRLDTESIT